MMLRLKYLLKAPALTNDQTADRFSIDGASQPTQPRPQPQSPKPDSPRPNAPTQLNQFQDDNSVCGVPVAGFTQSLVIGGTGAGHGEW